MQPCFAAEDVDMFNKHLAKASVYFEFGSGGSTCYANSKKNIRKVYSVESDVEWMKKVQKITGNSGKTVFFFRGLDSQPNTWGRPGPLCTKTQRVAYSDSIIKLNYRDQKSINFVLIDGRFRVACCLKAFNAVSRNCLVCFDDFLNRRAYHKVLDYYDVVEKTCANRMAILRKKPQISSVPAQIIQHFENCSE